MRQTQLLRHFLLNSDVFGIQASVARIISLAESEARLLPASAIRCMRERTMASEQLLKIMMAFVVIAFCLPLGGGEKFVGFQSIFEQSLTSPCLRSVS